jgi:hypothetical protein
MPNIPITPKTYMIILVATATNEVTGFMIKVSEQLIIEAQSRAVNFAFQYGAMAIGQAASGSKFVDPTAPAKLFVKGFESLTTAATPEERFYCGCYSRSFKFIFERSKRFLNVRWILNSTCPTSFTTRLSGYISYRFA